jgi:hypothetical protein
MVSFTRESFLTEGCRLDGGGRFPLEFTPFTVNPFRVNPYIDTGLE